MRKIILSIFVLMATSIVAIHTNAQEKNPPPPPTPPKVVKKQPPKVELARFTPPVINNEFLERNPDVERVYWKSGNRIVLKMKNKKEETYRLNDAGEKKNFTDKYGTPPPPPPPPPKVVRKEVI